ncbi:Ig-like domain-containing protein [Maridesulfovibrio sp.]|uniref:Ig-like domain-containing protein n=1 Tax=Maridesulfovibrio sp. TaxID=2795000 RepID=UPI0039EEA222
MFSNKSAFYTTLAIFMCLINLMGTGRAFGVVRTDRTASHSFSASEKERYSFFPLESEFIALNPDQSIQVRISADGALLTDSVSNNSISMKLSGVGRTALHFYGPARINAHENRLEAVSGPVTEWFVNRPEIGLEHGITLHERSEGEGPVRAVWKLGGDLTAVPGSSENEIIFKSEKGTVRFGGLKAWDAEGRDLPVHMVLVDAETMEYMLDDTGAAYPVTIDPIFSQIDKLTVKGGAVGDIFGESVAVSGDFAAVGASEKSSPTGVVYIYKRTGNTWKLTQTLTDPGSTARDYFGSSLDMDGYWLLIGAPGDTNETGTAYMYTRSGDTWSLSKELVIAEGAEGDSFGTSVTLDGNSAVVGAPWRDTFKGAVYTFKYTTTWLEEAMLTAGDGWVGDLFGSAVALSGSDLAVGAPRADTDSGKVYLYRDDGAGFVFSKMIQPSFSHADDRFGESLSFNDDMLAVGTPGRLANGKNTGAVLTFKRSNWELHQEIGMPAGGDEISSGTLVALSNNAMLVGAPESTRCGTNAGEIFVFLLHNNNWILAQRTCAADNAEGDTFGGSVALSGTTMLVGASGKDSLRGAVYVYDSSPPVTINLIPGNNTDNIAVNSIVQAVFDQEMNATSFSTSTFLLKRTEDDTAISGAVTWDFDMSTATFRPSGDLPPDSQFTAILTADVSNAVGLKKGSETSWGFTTGTGLDLEWAGIDSIFPASRASNVSVGSGITVCFKEDMDSSSITTETFNIDGVSGSVRYDASTRKAYFIPDADLSYSTVYNAVLTTGVKDLAGNPLPSQQSWIFTTAALSPDSDDDGTPDDQDSDPQDATKASFKSIVSDSEITLTLNAENGAVLRNVRSISPQDPSLDMTNYPDGVDFASGLVHFEIDNLTPGAEAKVTISCTGAQSGTPVVYKNGGSGFYSYNDHAQFDGTSCTLTLVDGGFGDEDLARNGRISDPVGLGDVIAPNSLVGGPSSGCMMNPAAGLGLEWLLVLLIPLLFRLRRGTN